MMHRLWFLLDDVLPLAEHAINCRAHEPATDIPVDVGPARPALIWAGTSSLDLLTSTGLPTWYGKGGTPHAAEAHAWRDPHGRYQTAGQDGYTTAYLPLTDACGRPGPAITLLRAGAHSGHGWLTLDIDPADKHLIGAYRLHAVPERDKTLPPDATWRHGTVTCPQVNGRTYPALIANYTSNGGDLLARFTRATAEQIADELRDMPEVRRPAGSYPAGRSRVRLDWNGDALTIHRLGPGQALTHRITDRVTPDRDGHYWLGAYVWPWQRTAGQAASRRLAWAA
ncbi:hypothetical protein ACQP2X_39570 [Actinoplanes sp. CA-131856]